jgi:lipopolysaccharide/colanic/teichoic acid biosynthesis glycosyltransferase
MNCSSSAAMDDAGKTGAPEYPPVSRWCTSRCKRVFDLVCAVALLLVTLPFMCLVSLAVLTSPGPLLFASDRLGQRGKCIRVLKFRTMRPHSEAGIHVTRKGDNRVTKAGLFLRKWKLDELPQFINVLRGDMSVVGPRPDMPEFLAALDGEFRSVLCLRPGITSAATLQFRNEEELLSSIPENRLVAYYVDTLLPEKIRLDLEYARQATFSTDLKIVIKTAARILA